MSFDYAKSAATADRLLKRFGAPATLMRRGEASGPDHAPVFGPPIEAPVTVALTDYSAMEKQDTLVAANDRKALMSAIGIAEAPGTEDRLRFGSEEFAIVRVDTLAPAGVPVMWTLQVRQP